MRVRWSVRAFEDRLRIFDYIASDSGQAALQIDESIKERMEALLAMPRSGRPGRLVNTREAVVNGTSYVVIYKATDTEVLVVRVLHGVQQWPAPASAR